MVSLTRTAAVLALALIVAVGCGGGSAPTTNAGCGPTVREALDSNLSHVLPGAPEPKYQTDPPTSGPHSPGASPAGVVSAPLSRPAQVGILEGGGVLVQYRDAGDLEALRTLANETTVVAPNPGLDGPVVATAWLFKVRCSSVDTAALASFAMDRSGHGPGSGG
ncbi:MAG: DUF3105 domain-containing protein [Acidimicrobiales bacterium]